jgi:transposase-like protein
MSDKPLTVWFTHLHDFKRALLRHYLAQGLSVAATARQLGMGRTRLVRLKRDFGVEGARPQNRGGRRSEPKATPHG